MMQEINYKEMRLAAKRALDVKSKMMMHLIDGRKLPEGFPVGEYFGASTITDRIKLYSFNPAEIIDYIEGLENGSE